jgi:SAM-dependent methyltransferase
MTADALLGPVFPDQGWVPAPRYLMRRARILSLMKALPVGRILEVGPGAATLLIEFALRGFRCTALESSDDARALATQLATRSGALVELRHAPSPDWNEAFDYLFAFDVLEHIEHDLEALRQWREWLKPGGTLMLSVPARMSLWTAGDEWAGHFRRYEKQSLMELVQANGFEVDVFECYGFPLTNISERVSASAYRKLIVREGDTTAANRKMNNDRSGIDRRPHLRLFPFLNSWAGRTALRCCLGVQRLFLGRDWGSGYVLRATRREPT